MQYNGVQQWQINAIQRQLASGSAHNVDALERSTANNSALDALVFELCTQLIRQRLDRNTPFESPLMHWLAVMGIDESANRLRRPQDYTRILAGMLYINRLLILEFALLLQP